mgnify:FL=1
MDADRIIVMNDGKVDGFDTHENLLKNNEIYRDVYDSQTNGGGDFDEGGAAWCQDQEDHEVQNPKLKIPVSFLRASWDLFSRNIYRPA